MLFSFWQMPYSARLYAGIFGMREPKRFLLSGTLVASGLWLCTLGEEGWGMLR